MAIFEAIGSLLGGILGNSSANKRQNQMLQWQERMDNTKIQRLQADAKAAGVHPLAAMGASLTSPSPVTVGGRPDFGDMGQNIGRAVDATMSSDQKESDYTKTAQALSLEKASLENDLLRTQLVNSAVATARQPSSPPTFRSGLAGTDDRGEEKFVEVFPNVPTDPRLPNSDDIQKRYDDWVSGPYGFLMALSDLYRSQNSILVPGDRIKRVMQKYRHHFERPALSAGRNNKFYPRSPFRR